MIPVDNEQVETHAEQAVNDFEDVEHFLDGVVVSEVVDGVLVLVALAVVLEHAVEVAPVDHGHGSVPVGVPAVSVEFVHRILQPRVALLLQGCLIHENVEEHLQDLHQLESIQQFTRVEPSLFNDEVALYDHDQ